MSLRGWIYVLVNPSLAGLVKVGFSTKDPALRVKELSSTGVPLLFSIAYEALVENPRDMEQRVHSNLKSSHESKEFFRTTPEAAVAAIRAVANEIGAELQLERDDLRAQGGKLATTPEAPHVPTPPARTLSSSEVLARAQVDVHLRRKTRVAQLAAMQPRLICPHCGIDRRPSTSGYCQSCFGLHRL